MNPRHPESDQPELPASESGVRRQVAEANGDVYAALRSLDEARRFADAIVVLEGDFGGQIYVVAPIGYVNCDEARLQALLAEVDAVQWDEPAGARVCFERQPTGKGIPGGMGGAVVINGVWVHERLLTHRAAIAAVLSGASNSIHP